MRKFESIGSDDATATEDFEYVKKRACARGDDSAPTKDALAALGHLLSLAKGHDINPQVRSEAVAILAGCDLPKACDVLRSIAENTHEHFALRREAIRALRLYLEKSAPARDTLFFLAENDQQIAVSATSEIAR